MPKEAIKKFNKEKKPSSPEVFSCLLNFIIYF